jgi:hypothetical protein
MIDIPDIGSDLESLKNQVDELENRKENLLENIKSLEIASDLRKFLDGKVHYIFTADIGDDEIRNFKIYTLNDFKIEDKNYDYKEDTCYSHSDCGNNVITLPLISLVFDKNKFNWKLLVKERVDTFHEEHFVEILKIIDTHDELVNYIEEFLKNNIKIFERRNIWNGYKINRELTEKAILDLKNYGIKVPQKLYDIYKWIIENEIEDIKKSTNEYCSRQNTCIEEKRTRLEKYLKNEGAEN